MMSEATSLEGKRQAAVEDRSGGYARILLRNWPIPLLLIGTWVARYWYSARFGLYEDDFTHIPTAVQMSWPALARFVADTVLHFRGSGHPVHLVFLYTLANGAWRVGGLHGLYILGWALLSVNAILFFKLVQRVGNTGLATLASLAYILYAADTTQAFLTHSLGIQPAIMMVLLSAHAYVRGRRALALGLSGLAILTYETTFFPALAIPLLQGPWDGTWRRNALRHAAGMVVILLADIVLRGAMGEGRVTGLDPATIVQVPLLHMLEGPPVALGTYLLRPWQALSSLDGEKAAFVGGGFLAVMFGFAIWTWIGRTNRLEGSRGDRAAPEAGSSGIAGRGAGPTAIVRLTVAAAAMLVLAYPVTFTVRAFAISGRDTRVHLAGVMGASLLVGTTMLAVLVAGRIPAVRLGIAVLIAVWAGAMLGYGLEIQRDYVGAWSLQRAFWTDLIVQIPDVSDGTVILVDPGALEDTRQIGANYWNLPRVLSQLYMFPEDWASAPRVYRLLPAWRDTILTDDGRLELDASTVLAPDSTYGDFDPANTILLVGTATGVERVSSFLAGGGQVVHLMPRDGSGEPPFPRGFLYSLLIGDRTGPQGSVGKDPGQGPALRGPSRDSGRWTAWDRRQCCAARL